MTVELTDLQHAALQMLADRFPEREIAAYLRVSRGDVRQVLLAVCARMRVHHRQQAVYLARQLGMLDTAGVVA